MTHPVKHPHTLAKAGGWMRATPQRTALVYKMQKLAARARRSDEVPMHMAELLTIFCHLTVFGQTSTTRVVRLPCAADSS